MPPGALFNPGTGQTGQQSYVWVVDEGSKRVARRAVRTGTLTPVGLPVLEGLKSGEWVVTAGVHSLREGQEVRIPREGSR